MAQLLVLEFDGVNEADYRRVNGLLGVDLETGEGDWPAGMKSHCAWLADTGSFFVAEIWESQEAQHAFMESRLGAALAGAGVTSVPTVTWATLLGVYPKFD